MSLARAARKLVTEGRKHFRDLSGNDSKTGKPLTTRQKAGGEQIKLAAEGTRAVRAGERKGAVVGGGAVVGAGVIAARKAFRDLGAAYRQSVKDAQSGKTSRKAVKALSKAKLSAFEKAFADAAKSGKKTFKFEVDGVMKPFTVTYKKNKK